jgi:GNAT superfamily N-acetyltransferase
MTAAVKVRRLTSTDDLSAAQHLLQRFFREEGFDTPEHTIAHHTQVMASLDMCGLFVADVERISIGVATVSLEFGIEYGWSAEMGDLYVLQEYRGKGVSRALVEAIESFLKGKGAAGYQVTVTPYAETHHELTAFYRALGFEAGGRQLLYKHLVPRA